MTLKKNLNQHLSIILTLFSKILIFWYYWYKIIVFKSLIKIIARITGSFVDFTKSKKFKKYIIISMLYRFSYLYMIIVDVKYILEIFRFLEYI